MVKCRSCEHFFWDLRTRRVTEVKSREYRGCWSNSKPNSNIFVNICVDLRHGALSRFWVARNPLSTELWRTCNVFVIFGVLAICVFNMEFIKPLTSNYFLLRTALTIRHFFVSAVFFHRFVVTFFLRNLKIFTPWTNCSTTVKFIYTCFWQVMSNNKIMDSILVTLSFRKDTNFSDYLLHNERTSHIFYLYWNTPSETSVLFVVGTWNHNPLNSRKATNSLDLDKMAHRQC